MAPSTEIPLPVEGRVFGYRSIREINLPPVETVSDPEQIKSLSEQLMATPQAIFRFSLIDLGQNRRFDHLELVGRLCDFGRHHPTTGEYGPDTLKCGEEYREYLFKSYQARIVFDHTGPASIQISPETKRATRLSFGELVRLSRKAPYFIRDNQALHALLALNEKQQERIFEAVEQFSLAFLFLVKRSTLVGRTEMLEPADGIIIIKQIGERNFVVGNYQFSNAQSMSPQAPFFVALHHSC